MDKAEIYDIGPHHVAIAAREGVGPPTPYTLLLAESIPDLSALNVVDVGTGSGLLAIVACLQGAERVYVLDTNDAAVSAAIENAERNGVRDHLVHLPIGNTIIPLPEGTTVDVVISNPAQLPSPKRERSNSPYYAGGDGRAMIEEVIRQTPSRLSPAGRLLMVHNSATDFPRSMVLLESVGLKARILAERTLELRPLFDRDWLDHLGGPSRGLYSVRDGRAYETIYVVEAFLQRSETTLISVDPAPNATEIESRAGQ